MNDWFDADSHIDRAHRAYEEGRLDEAEKALRDALSLNPFRAEWHFNLGLTLEAAGRFEDAVKAFTDCLDLDCQDANIPLLIGVNLLRAGKAAEAIPHLERARGLAPDQAAPYIHQIEAHARLGEHEQAEVMFYLAQQINPKDAGAYANLAESLIARELYDKAIWCLREASHLDPRLPRVHARLAYAYARTGRLERARQLYLRELRNDPGDLETLIDIGCLLVDMDRYPEADEKFRRVLELEPDQPDAHYFLADLTERQGRVDAAREQFEVVLKLDPGFTGVRTRLGALLLRSGAPGDGDRARELLREDYKAFTDEPGRLGEAELEDLGRALIEASMFAEARGALEEFVARRPTAADGLHLLSVARYGLGDVAEGMTLGRRAVRSDPKCIAAMHNLAVACAQEREWRRARYWVRRALSVDPDDGAMRRLRWRLWVQGLLTSFKK